MFYVCGGQYADLEHIRASKVEILGPFQTREGAQIVWRDKSIAHTDNDRVRYSLVPADEMERWKAREVIAG